MALQAGELIGPYRIVGQFGQGGMTTVYKAYHPQLKRQVATKFLHQSYKDQSAYLMLGKASWLRNEHDASQKFVEEDYTVATDNLAYLLEVASVATQLNHVTASIFLNGQALFLAPSDVTRYPQVRAEVVKTLFTAAQIPSDINLRELERLNQSIPDFQQPALFDIMAVQILMAQKRLPLAQVAYNRLSDATAKLPEAYLIHGELLQTQGNIEKAKKEWKTILLIPDTPQWVTERVTELINSN